MRLSDMTSVKPSTLGELQLYKVLQRANLLSYYDAFISQGGDDVQQLCEAGEEEFLEIMALVSMACKPLHVRRLQKALQEWVTRPAIFRSANMHYLPAQSISLTSLGIDTRDLILPPQNSPRNSTSPGFQRDTSAPQSQDDDILSQPLSMNGSAVTTPKSSSGLLNVFRLDDRPRKLNGVSSSADSPEERERPDGDAVSAFLDTAIQKYVSSPITLLDKKDVISQLQADRSHRELAVAIDNENRPRMEALIKDFVKLARDHEDGTASRHEVLIVDAAVKLCTSDVRWLLKKTELLATAEKIANEVKSKYATRRRSSTHLHGSCSQSRIQEVNKLLQNIKTQRTSLHKKLAEAQANKNVIKENECQNILTCIARDEVTLLQEKKELTKKLQNEVKPQAAGMESSFSSELAGYYNSDLAKAHNLNFGNLQPSTSNWTPVENGVSNARKTPENGSSPSHTATVSPGHLSVGDVRSLQDSERTPPGLLQIKRESDVDDDAFPSKANGAVKLNKRKRSATGSPEGSNSKKLVGATDAEIE